VCRAQPVEEEKENVDEMLMKMMQAGAFFWKHDFGRNKRSRKAVTLSKDGLSLKWQAVGANQQAIAGVGPDGSPKKRSNSFQRSTSSES
jgi:hypothetical protein